jgi:hypothetical protein
MRLRSKAGYAVGRVSWRSSLQGDPGAKFLCEKPKKETSSKKESTAGPWKLTLLWESAKSADSHSSLKKPRKRREAFSQFPQAQQQLSIQV